MVGCYMQSLHSIVMESMLSEHYWYHDSIRYMAIFIFNCWNSCYQGSIGIRIVSNAWQF